jgi:hypothetical protein
MRHNRMDLLEERLKDMGEGVERVWYLCDGVYSMLGDYAPVPGPSSGCYEPIPSFTSTWTTPTP